MSNNLRYIILILSLLFVEKEAFAQCPTEVRTLCNGGAYELATPQGLTDIQWYIDTGIGKKAIESPRGNQPILIAEVVGVYSFTARDTNGCSIDLCCPFQLVKNNPILIANQPVSFIECINTRKTLSVVILGDTNALSFQWQTSLDSLRWSDIPYANQSIFTPNSQVIGRQYYRAFIKDTINLCDSLFSQAASVTVVTKPTISVSTATPSVCKGMSVTLNAHVIDGTGTCQIQWQSSSDNGLNWQNILGATTPTFQTPPMNASTLFQAVLSCSNDGCCN